MQKGSQREAHEILVQKKKVVLHTPSSQPVDILAKQGCGCSKFSRVQKGAIKNMNMRSTEGSETHRLRRSLQCWRLRDEVLVLPCSPLGFLATAENRALGQTCFYSSPDWWPYAAFWCGVLCALWSSSALCA